MLSRLGMLILANSFVFICDIESLSSVSVEAKTMKFSSSSDFPAMSILNAVATVVSCTLLLDVYLPLLLLLANIET